MLVKITVKIKMLDEACVMQHAPGIAAHRKLLAGFNKMMFIEPEYMAMMRNGAAVHDGLPVIFTRQLQIVQFEQTIGRRIETDIAGFFLPAPRYRYGSGDRPLAVDR